MSAAYKARQAERLARIHAELERLRVGVEVLRSGAVRLRRGGCQIMAAGFDHITEDDLETLAGGPTRARTHAVLGFRA